MKILLESFAFAPSIGGIETVSEILAEEWISHGHEVIVLTATPCTGGEKYTYPVVRNPNIVALIKLTNWCDVIFQNNLSLNLLWPNLLLRHSAVVTVQTWLGIAGGSRNLLETIKANLHRICTCVSISKAVAGHLPCPSTVLGNPYRDDIFRLRPEIKRSGDLVFVGRLVSDKGADLLLQALSLLKEIGISPSLTIVGDGPERKALLNQCDTLELSEQVKFVGVKRGEKLCMLLNAHKIIVVPSLWAEPFGIVAIEGIACGCAVVGSEEGGLAEAIGPCGITFPNGDSGALADCLRMLLQDSEQMLKLTAKLQEHLRKYQAQVVAQTYLEIFESLLA